MMFVRGLTVAMAYLLGIGTLLSWSEARASGDAHMYMNAEYGFSVRIPPGRATCRAEPYIHDTGIMIFLDRGPSDCVNQNRRPFVAVNGTYNATDARNSLEALSSICGSIKPQPTDLDVLGDLKKEWPVMCRIQKEGGFVEYILIRQNRPVTTGATSTINYSIVINIPASDLSQKMRGVRPIVQSIRLRSSGIAKADKVHD